MASGSSVELVSVVIKENDTPSTSQVVSEESRRFSDPCSFDEEVITDLKMLEKKMVEQNYGWDQTIRYVSGELDAWKHATVKVAVVGGAGSGKSSVINTMRKLKPKEKGAAKVGFSETTLAITSYEFSGNKNIKLFDVPGAGTNKWPIETYMETIKASEFDFFLIVTSLRFSENDITIAKQVVELNKPFAYIRTRVDADVVHAQEDYDKEEEDILSDIREDVENQLLAANKGVEDKYKLQPKALFLINARKQEELEFPKLMDFLINSLRGAKYEAVLMSVNTFTKSVLEMKEEMLCKRIWSEALGSDPTLFQPFPSLGPGVSVNMECIQKSIPKYAKVFGVEQESLEKIGTSVSEIISVEAYPMVKLAVQLEQKEKVDIAQFLNDRKWLETAKTGKGFLEWLKLFIKRISHKVKGDIPINPKSYNYTALALRTIIRSFSEDVTKLVMEKARK